MRCCAGELNAERIDRFQPRVSTFRWTFLKTGAACPYLLQLSSQEIWTGNRIAVFAGAATAFLITLAWVGAAFASQGPGGGRGTASSFTQLAMAVIVWGSSALVIGAGLIGALRGH
jgi:hypothetical protein